MTAKNANQADLEARWDLHGMEWRDPAQITSQWRDASQIDPNLLQSQTKGSWWGVLEQLGITLFITREYEHLVVAMSARAGRPRVSFLPMPHPSGLLVDRARKQMFLASTRNPNQIYVLKPTIGVIDRSDVRKSLPSPPAFVPVMTTYYPGCLYLHDLALIAGKLHANAVGHNAVVRLLPEGQFDRVWWPKCIEQSGKPLFDRNQIQLNSIAAGSTLKESFFSASSSRLGRLRPGHLNYKVDKQGVIFSGRTRQPMCTGLTRPHSARLWKGDVWVANSGYGELGFVANGRLNVVLKLSGWTRGLCFVKGVAFIATSRVIPRFSRYAPGLDNDRSRCGVSAVCLKTGQLLGSLEWPLGNQVFAIDWIRDDVSSGFAFQGAVRGSSHPAIFHYRYET